MASGSKDTTVKVWSYDTGATAQTCSASNEVRGLAQISSNLLAIGRNHDEMIIWCFTNNTQIRTINAGCHIRVIQVLTSTKIVVGTGTSNGKTTMVIDWTTESMNRYQKDVFDVNDLAITSGMLVVSTSEGSTLVSVRNVTNYDISAVSTLCSKTFSGNVKSIVAKDTNSISKLLFSICFNQL